MYVPTITEIAAAHARRFRGRRGARGAARRRAARNMAAPPAGDTMDAGPDPEEMEVPELRAALRELGVRYSGRAGQKRLAVQLREALADGDSG